MDKSYAQIVQEIESLQKEAESVRAKEIEGVIARIREAIAIYGLTPADLGFTGTKPAARRGRPPSAKKAGRPAKKRASAEVKFRDKAGNTWSGRGKRPNWLREALDGGKSLEDFAVR